MYRVSDFSKQVYKTGEVMKLLNVSYSTIKGYDKSGKLVIHRTPAGRRVVFREDILNYLDQAGLLLRDEDHTSKHDVIYARVSSNEQKQKGDLDRQVMFLLEHVNDLQNPLVLKEVGSGLNDQRRKVQQLIQMVLEGKVNRVYITYKDRLTRFGYHYLETVFLHAGVQIIVIRDRESQKSVNEELAEDMMSLIASFSGRLYGMRSGRRRKAGKNQDTGGDQHE